MDVFKKQPSGPIAFAERFEEVRARLRERPLWRAEHLETENRRLREAIAAPRTERMFVGSSAAARKVQQAIRAFASLDGSLLIAGETGVGKRLVAHLVHDAGPLAECPFVAVSCAALPRELLEAEIFGSARAAAAGAARRPGRVELAEGGTLFLDEIAEVPPELQPKLVALIKHRVYQPVGGARAAARVRILASTSRDLRGLVHEKRFNRELFGRLNAVSMRVPPLRERLSDVPAIASYLLTRFGHRRRSPDGFAIDEDARRALVRYRWPGNVRELERALQRAVAVCSGYRIGRDDLPAELLAAPPGSETNVPWVAGVPLREIERLAIEQTLGACGGNGAEAARRLGISKKGMYIKMKRFGLTTRGT